MPAAVPIIAGAAFGAGAPYLGAVIAGTAITEAVVGSIIAGAILGGIAGAIPLVLQQLLGRDAPRFDITGSIDDVSLNTSFSRTASIPVVYGFREVDVNCIHLGKTEYRDVMITATGRNESHLFAEILLGVGEGPCREALAFYIGDTPQRIGTWRFQQGTVHDVPEPELNDDCAPGRNFPYIHTAKVFFNGDLGFVTGIPDFHLDLRGIYPDFVVNGLATVGWKPQRATLDGPTNTLVISPDPETVEGPKGVVLYRIPYEDGSPVITYTRPPAAITSDDTRFFYFGLIDAIVCQDPDNPTIWYTGRPGLTPDSEEWMRHDLGGAFNSPVFAVLRDERTCKTHSLHKHDDGHWFIVSMSWVTSERFQRVLPDGGFTSVVRATFKAEDTAWYMIVTGGGPSRLVRHHLETQEWTTIAQLDSDGVVDIIKLGVLIFVFYGQSVTQVDASSGEVVEGMPLSEFMSELDGNSLGTEARCLGCAVSRHRYSGIAVFTNEDGSDWRISVFHEPRADGDSFPRPAPFRRWCLARASAGTYIAKPGFPVTAPPMEQVVWIGNDQVQAGKSLDDMIADGADYKTATAAGDVPDFMRPATVAAIGSRVSWIGAPNGAAALSEAIPDDSNSYVHMEANGISPSYFRVKLAPPPNLPPDGARHVFSYRFRSQNSVYPHTIRFRLIIKNVLGVETVIASSGELPHLSANHNLWVTGSFTLTDGQVGELVSDPIFDPYTNVYVEAFVEVGFPLAFALAGFDWTWVELKLGGSPQIETLATGLTAYSYYPVHQNRREERRVLFVRNTSSTPGTTLYEWWFTVKGGAACADRDFSHSEEITLPFYAGVSIDDTHTQLTDFRRSLDNDYYIGYRIFSGLSGGLNPFRDVFDYDGATGILTHEAWNGSPGGSVTVTLRGPEWTLKHWSIQEPTQIDIPQGPVSSTENPPFALEGRYIGKGWNLATSIGDIVAALKDNGFPEEPAIEIEVTQHPGLHTLSGLLYYVCGPIGSDRCAPAPTPVVPNMPLTQFRLDTATFPEVFYNTAAALGEAELTDFMLEWTDHNIVSGACNSQSLVRDCFGYDAAGELVTIGTECSVASWEATKIVIVQDRKAEWTEMSISSTGFRHDWFEGRTTPGGIRVHYLRKGIFGAAKKVEEIDVAAHLSLHGYSLEQVNVDGQRIRRFIWNAKLIRGERKADIDVAVLAPAGASALSVDGRESLVFETSGIETIMDFDASMIVPDTLSVAVKSANAAANRLVVGFYNGLDKRNDYVGVSNQDNIESTGSVRESSITVEMTTDASRAFLVGSQALMRPLTDRHGATFRTGGFARMLLNAGDPIGLNHPQGHFRRKPFRILSIDDSNEDVDIECESISPYTTDDRVDPGLRSTAPEADLSAGGFAAVSLQRDLSIERFHGVPLAPMRTLAALRSDGTAILMGTRAPTSGMTMGIRAKLTSSTESSEFDNLRVTKPRSMALMDDVLGDGTYAFRGLIDVPGTIRTPAQAFLLKRVTADPSSDVVAEVTATRCVGGSVTDPEGEGTIALEAVPDSLAFTVDSSPPATLWAVTADPSTNLEPRRYDNEPMPAQSWRNPGQWTDISASIAPVLARRGDFVVIAIDGGSWMPNCLRLVFDTPALEDQRLIFEYSCVPDPGLPLRVWKPLTVLDGTKGCRQSGRVHIEIPSDWRQTRAWDQHGNRVPDDRRFLIRIQRRQRSGSGARLMSVTLENRPLLLVVPPAPATVRLPEMSQGQGAMFRFVSRSVLPDQDVGRSAATWVESTGGRWRLSQVAYPRMVAPENLNIEEDDSYDPPDSVPVTIQWQYASLSHGWGATAFGKTVYGVAQDPHLSGTVVSVRRQSDGAILRRDVMRYPENEWTYEWALREADGVRGMDLVLVQFDDRGFYGPELVFSLERPGAS